MAGSPGGGGGSGPHGGTGPACACARGAHSHGRLVQRHDVGQGSVGGVHVAQRLRRVDARLACRAGRRSCSAASASLGGGRCLQGLAVPRRMRWCVQQCTGMHPGRAERAEQQRRRRHRCGRVKRWHAPTMMMATIATMMASTQELRSMACRRESTQGGQAGAAGVSLQAAAPRAFTAHRWQAGSACASPGAAERGGARAAAPQCASPVLPHAARQVGAIESVRAGCRQDWQAAAAQGAGGQVQAVEASAVAAARTSSINSTDSRARRGACGIIAWCCCCSKVSICERPAACSSKLGLEPSLWLVMECLGESPFSLAPFSLAPPPGPARAGSLGPSMACVFRNLKSRTLRLSWCRSILPKMLDVCPASPTCTAAARRGPPCGELPAWPSSQ